MSGEHKYFFSSIKKGKCRILFFMKTIYIFIIFCSYNFVCCLLKFTIKMSFQNTKHDQIIVFEQNIRRQK